MAYSELIKSFNRIREYMREFYVCGFKSRDEYTKKSARSYDDEKRRMESLLGDFMRFRRTPEGKNVFLSIDSRVMHHNPLFRAWKAKSFTDGDLTLHFILSDILASREGLTVPEITDRLAERMPETDRCFDESTVRKKLKEYVREGIVQSEKDGRNVRYFLQETTDLSACADALDYFSEVAPCGVIGSFLLDKTDESGEHFAFKHHYVTGSLDSEIVCTLFEAMREKRRVTLETLGRDRETVSEKDAVPLRLLFSVQNGRQYLMAYLPRARQILSFRTDRILSVKAGDKCEEFDSLRASLDKMKPHLWGVNTNNRNGRKPEHVEFTVRFDEDEPFILNRLEREKRCGTVERLSDTTARFSADVFDSGELIPWIRTFFCRLTDLHFSDKKLEEQFLDDLHAMYALYGIGEGGDEA